MIQKLTIKNYKGFNGEVSVELRPLSLITGSEGKTSILNALRLLREELHVIIPNLTSANGVTDIYKPEKLPSVVDRTNSLNRLTKTRSIVFEVIEDDEKFSIESISIDPLRFNKPKNISSIFVDGYFRFIENKTRNEKLFIPQSKCSEIIEWMTKIYPSFRLSLSLYNPQYESHPIWDVRDLSDGAYYALRIISELFHASLKEKSLILLETPEAFLPELAQSTVAQLIGMIVDQGVQVVLTTHSEILLGGIRVAIRERVVDSDKVGISFLTNSSELGIEARFPYIDSDAKIHQWYDGFFDQLHNDLLKLL